MLKSLILLVLIFVMPAVVIDLLSTVEAGVIQDDPSIFVLEARGGYGHHVVPYRGHGYPHHYRHHRFYACAP